MTCRQCQSSNDDGAKFCSECGARLQAVCGACGAPSGGRFCSECGAALTGAAPPPVPAPRPDPVAERRTTTFRSLRKILRGVSFTSERSMPDDAPDAAVQRSA